MANSTTMSTTKTKMTRDETTRELKKLIRPTMLKVTLQDGQVGVINPIDFFVHDEIDFTSDDGHKVISAKDVADINVME